MNIKLKHMMTITGLELILSTKYYSDPRKALEMGVSTSKL